MQDNAELIGIGEPAARRFGAVTYIGPAERLLWNPDPPPALSATPPSPA
jgi:hypothetical protein